MTISLLLICYLTLINSLLIEPLKIRIFHLVLYYYYPCITYPLDYAPFVFGFDGDLAVIIVPSVLLYAHVQRLEQLLALFGLGLDVLLGAPGELLAPEEEVAQLLPQIHVRYRHLIFLITTHR